jgi:hypothetical protein
LNGKKRQLEINNIGIRKDTHRKAIMQLWPQEEFEEENPGLFILQTFYKNWLISRLTPANLGCLQCSSPCPLSFSKVLITEIQGSIIYSSFIS